MEHIDDREPIYCFHYIHRSGDRDMLVLEEVVVCTYHHAVKGRCNHRLCSSDRAVEAQMQLRVAVLHCTHQILELEMMRRIHSEGSVNPDDDVILLRVAVDDALWTMAVEHHICRMSRSILRVFPLHGDRHGAERDCWDSKSRTLRHDVDHRSGCRGCRGILKKEEVRLLSCHTTGICNQSRGAGSDGLCRGLLDGIFRSPWTTRH